MNIPIEKLGAAYFSENLQLFATHQTNSEKYNHYNGFRDLSETVEVLYLAVHNIEKQLNSINQKLEILSRIYPPIKKYMSCATRHSSECMIRTA